MLSTAHTLRTSSTVVMPVFTLRNPLLSSGSMPSPIAFLRSSVSVMDAWISSWIRCDHLQELKDPLTAQVARLAASQAPGAALEGPVPGLGKGALDHLQLVRVGLDRPMQSSQLSRTSRCEITSLSVAAIRYGSMPISRRRLNAEVASLVWRVLSTRWPVREARMAIWAVSRSRISPIRMMSGSWRRIERRAWAKSRPIPGRICIWLMPGSWYSTGILDRLDVLLRALEVVQGAVEGGGLAAAGGAGQQDDAVGELQHPLEPRHHALLETDVHHVDQQRRLVQHPQHQLLPVDLRQGGHADVDDAVVDLELEPPVQRQAPFGDIHVGQDLDAGHDGRVEPLGRRGDFAQEPVDPQPDRDVVLPRLEMDVAGPVAHRLHQHQVHEPHHRRIVGVHAKLVRVHGQVARCSSRPDASSSMMSRRSFSMSASSR